MKLKELIVKLQELDERRLEEDVYLVVDPYYGKLRSVYLDDYGKLVISTEK
jgi:hypothetical protein